MSKNNDILDLLKSIAKDVSEMKIAIEQLQEENSSAAVNSEKMYKMMNAKIDIFKNLESESREAVAQKTSSSKKLTNPSFMKKIFMEDRDKYINILYTQEELDAIFQHEDVVKKKKEEERITKAGTLIYALHIKADNPKGRQSQFESIFSQANDTL